MSNLHRHYTSRTAIEAYQKCPRLRYLEFLYQSRGLRPAGTSIFLSTGSALHKGIETIATAIKGKASLNNNPELVDAAVAEALYLYREIVQPEELSGGKLSTLESRQFAYGEQQAMVEACVRVWAAIELPNLISRFNIIEVEQDKHTLLTTTYHPVAGTTGNAVSEHDVYLESKTDLLLEDKQTGDYYVYSLKGLKDFPPKAEETYKHDLQTITEIWTTEEVIKAENQKIRDALAFLEHTPQLPGQAQTLTNRYKHALEGMQRPERVMGAKFCILIKGKRAELEDDSGQGTGIWFTYNPFIRGYRNIAASATEVKYAHSWFYHSPKNVSGKTILGKGWTPFFVWEDYKGGVKQWMADIASGHIQPEYSEDRNPLAIYREHIVTPTEVFRDQEEIDTSLAEIRLQEQEVFRDATDEDWQILFPRYRHSCWYPQECPYVPICWGDTYKGHINLDDAIASGQYRWRIPHHEQELQQHINLTQIQGVTTDEPKVESTEG